MATKIVFSGMTLCNLVDKGPVLRRILQKMDESLFSQLPTYLLMRTASHPRRLLFAAVNIYLGITMCVLLFFTLDAELLARSQYSEGPATATSTQVFLGFPVSISKC